MGKCYLCPRNCLVDRDKGEVGYCGCGSDIRIARYGLHMWEEPCISGENGSGTIFFVGCNMRCCYCQNYVISENCDIGRVVSVEEFSNICLALQESGANNINLVTGCMYVPLIIDGIKMARSKGLNIPIIYNTSSYENVDTIKLLDGYVDVYLADLKYYDNKLGLKYSKCSNYFDYASNCIDEMYKQVPWIEYDSNGLIRKGVIVRHLMLPGNYNDSKNCIKYLYDKYGDNIIISIMNQYTPVRCVEYSELNNTVSDKVYDNFIDYAYDMGIRNAYVQEGGACSESFIPDFNEFNGLG